jgi:hypothetical protein
MFDVRTDFSTDHEHCSVSFQLWLEAIMTGFMFGTGQFKNNVLYW